MEQRITQQSTNSECDHDGEGGRINIRGAQCEEEIGRAGDVESRQDGIYGGTAWKQDCEDTGSERWCLGIGSEFIVIQVLNEGAILTWFTVRWNTFERWIGGEGGSLCWDVLVAGTRFPGRSWRQLKQHVSRHRRRQQLLQRTQWPHGGTGGWRPL